MRHNSSSFILLYILVLCVFLFKIISFSVDDCFVTLLLLPFDNFHIETFLLVHTYSVHRFLRTCNLRSSTIKWCTHILDTTLQLSLLHSFKIYNENCQKCHRNNFWTHVETYKLLCNLGYCRCCTFFFLFGLVGASPFTCFLMTASPLFCADFSPTSFLISVTRYTNF